MFGFYNIDINYLEFLHSHDSEVEYSPSYRSSSKEKIFLGIITSIEDKKYFIPFTSAKRSHENSKMTLSSKNHMLIYEEVDKKHKNTYTDKFYRSTDEPDKFLMLLSSLQFNKAIPVMDGLYHYVDISTLSDQKYKNLLIKEYSFCLSRQNEITQTALNTINAIKKGVPVKFACNLNLLEEKMVGYH